MGSMVQEWLYQVGLGHHISAFAGVSERDFKGLMMQVWADPLISHRAEDQQSTLTILFIFD